MFDLRDLARFPWQYNPFSCLVVPRRGMKFPLKKRFLIVGGVVPP